MTIKDVQIETEYMRFILWENKPKTQVWNIQSKSSNALLGLIKWYGPWRQYCFFPENETTFNSKCLDQIQTHINDLNRVHKEFAKRK